MYKKGVQKLQKWQFLTKSEFFVKKIHVKSKLMVLET